MKNLILIERAADLTILRLNRPEKRNALSVALLEQLCVAINEAEQIPGQRVLIITGNGSAFCAGMDLDEAKDPKKLDSLAQLIAKTLTAIYSSPLVTIAAVNGAAIAGGAGIMSACDFVIAVENVQMGYPEIRIGLVAAQVSTLLVRQASWRVVRELLLLGELIDAKRALEIGLINSIASQEELMLSAIGLAQKISRNDFGAIRATKELLAKIEPHPLGEQLQQAIEVHKQARLAYMKKLST
ncbi:MAG: enoyl-CoA hydratase/isomerase family protein [Parachlamydiaceae bacterium]|nr:enoyl-CoA hydratase/isomerase family protein [Parachlamydiaceae bacterium]